MVDVEKRIVKATGLSSTFANLPTAWRIYDDTLNVIPNDFKGMELVLGQDLLIHYDAKRNRAGFRSNSGRQKFDTYLSIIKHQRYTFPKNGGFQTSFDAYYQSNISEPVPNGIVFVHGFPVKSG